MRKFIYKAMILILSVGIFNSCLVETDSVLDLNEQGPNLASFEQSRAVFAVTNAFQILIEKAERCIFVDFVIYAIVHALGTWIKISHCTNITIFSN